MSKLSIFCSKTVKASIFCFEMSQLLIFSNTVITKLIKTPITWRFSKEIRFCSISKSQNYENDLRTYVFHFP